MKREWRHSRHSTLCFICIILLEPHKVVRFVMLKILDPVHQGQGEMDEGDRAHRVLGCRFHKQENII